MKLYRQIGLPIASRKNLKERRFVASRKNLDEIVWANRLVDSDRDIYEIERNNRQNGTQRQGIRTQYCAFTIVGAIAPHDLLKGETDEKHFATYALW